MERIGVAARFLQGRAEREPKARLEGAAGAENPEDVGGLGPASCAVVGVAIRVEPLHFLFGEVEILPGIFEKLSQYVTVFQCFH